MEILNPQGQYATPTTEVDLLAPFAARIADVVVGKQSWWINTPVPLSPSQINADGSPASGSVLSLSRGPAKIKSALELKEYWNEGETAPAAVYVVKESFQITGNLLSVTEAMHNLLSGGRAGGGIVGGTTGGNYARFPVTMIARNLNPHAPGRRLVVVSIYSAYAEGIEYEVGRADLSQISVTFKAARPAGQPANVGIGRVLFL